MLEINDTEGDIDILEVPGIMIEGIDISLIQHLCMNIMIDNSLSTHPHIAIMRVGETQERPIVVRYAFDVISMDTIGGNVR